ncbi:hypothetical protein [endosymbiont 'TC1' of Trimyema compressum]|uniref:hypothetical protein n=1 Tax=endosymbiont 'TC1' of Trimyema compressum TaxID=243899 RepID=UPI000B4CC20C|nr:hypothetical protein [endosymbiont 'TC1' of Trimyema compressum]
MVPCGTTTCFVEFLDFIGSAKDKGVEAAKGLFKNYQNLPYRIFAFAPAKKVELETTKALLNEEPVIGLGEFDHFTYSSENAESMEAMACAKVAGGLVNGHWGLTTLSDNDLNIIPAIGANNNHDVWNSDDIAKSLRYGFATQIKFGVGKV